jgi:hypothetical protein
MRKWENGNKSKLGDIHADPGIIIRFRAKKD